MARVPFDPDIARLALDAERRRRIAETLGSAPREVLTALVDYGLSDGDIARYHHLPLDVVTQLREGWHIPRSD